MNRIEGLEKFFTLSPDLLCVLDFDGRFLTLNPAWEYMLGYSNEELCSFPYFHRIHPDDRAQCYNAVSRLTRETSTVAMLSRYQCKDGSYKWLRWNCTSDVSRGEIYAIGRDVTSLKCLQDANQALNSVISAVPQAVIAVDVELNVRVWNPAAARMFGWDEAEVLGDKVPFLIVGNRTNFETKICRKNGTPIDVFVSVALTYDANGVMDGFVIVAR